YARTAIVQLGRVREGADLEEDHMRNRQMVVRWLMANTTAIEVRARDGKTYYVVTDPQAYRQGVGRLLADVQRIKAEGDYAAAKQLFETYGVHFDPKLRDEVVARVDRLQLPSYTGFVMPKLEAVTGPSGGVTEVTISYPRDCGARLRQTRCRGGAGTDRADGEHERGLWMPLQAVDRCRRRGARPSAELSAVRASGQPRTGDGPSLRARPGRGVAHRRRGP